MYRREIYTSNVPNEFRFYPSRDLRSTCVLEYVTAALGPIVVLYRRIKGISSLPESRTVSGSNAPRRAGFGGFKALNTVEIGA